jgi:hypothetical protein
MVLWNYVLPSKTPLSCCYKKKYRFFKGTTNPYRLIFINDRNYVTVGWVVPLLQIEEVPVSDLGPKTVNPEDVFR